MKLWITLYTDEDGVGIVECPQLPVCVSQGSTKDEAVENIRDAIQACWEVRSERGLPRMIETREIDVAA